MREALAKLKLPGNSLDQNTCWQDGRVFEDKEDWVVDSCTKCTCQVKRQKEKKHSEETQLLQASDQY